MIEEKDFITTDENQEASEQPTTSNENLNEESIDQTPNLEEQLAEQKDKFLRLFAEFDNYKKRVAKERLELFATAGKDVLIEFISVLDDLERAMKSNEKSEDLSAIKEGMTLIYDKFMKIFEKKGVTKIQSIGHPFDPDCHEAITEVPAPTEDMKGKVVDEIESGYKLADKIIRFSKVVVGK